MSASLSSAILYLDGVTVSFDGFKALNGLSLALDPGEMRAIIGPNGAGKTTMMDVITGKARPDQGTILYDGKVDLTGLDEAAIAGLGIGRKFQKPTVFEGHSVAANIELALSGGRGVWQSILWQSDRARRARVDDVLSQVGLAAQGGAPAAELSHGQKQWLEIGMLLAQDPRVLLVDEPAAGMTDAERSRTVALLRSIAERHSVIVVEHDMAFVRDLGVKVTVLHEGAVLAEGPLDQVSADRRVIEVYLGR